MVLLAVLALIALALVLIVTSPPVHRRFEERIYRRRYGRGW